MDGALTVTFRAFLNVNHNLYYKYYVPSRQCLNVGFLFARRA